MRSSAAALDAWHDGGRSGPRPPGRLRAHPVVRMPLWQRLLAAPRYHAIVDPDGRPAWMKVRGRH